MAVNKSDHEVEQGTNICRTTLDKCVSVFGINSQKAGELKEDTYDIQTKFGDLVDHFEKSISRRYTLNEFKTQLRLGVRASEMAEKIIQAKSHAEVLMHFDTQWSWFNSGFLKVLVLELGDENDKRQLENYDSLFAKYLKRRVFEIPPGAYGEDKHCGVRLIVKLDEEWDQYLLNDVMNTKRILANVLGMSEYHLFLLTVDDGCIQLTFRIPHMLSHRLTTDQKLGLCEAKVITMICGSKTIFRRQKFDKTLKERKARSICIWSHNVLRSFVHPC